MPKPIEILKNGQFTDMAGQKVSFSETELSEIAQGYSPEKFEAPLVVGHPQHDLPAYGWVKEVSLADGVLKAIPQQVEAQFSEMVNAGRFKKVSASLFLPNHPSNPTPGKHYLKHVGFLGAAAPAVQGLKTVAFSQDENNVLTVELSLENTEAPKTQSKSESNKENEELDKQQKALEAKERELAQREAGLKEKETEIKTKEQSILRSELASFVDGLVNEGKVIPGMKKDLVSFMESIHGQSIIQLSEEKQSTPLDFFKSYLKKQPKAVNLGEFNPDNTLSEGSKSPEAVAEEATRLKAKLQTEGTTISFAEAVERVTGGQNGKAD